MYPLDMFGYKNVDDLLLCMVDVLPVSNENCTSLVYIILGVLSFSLGKNLDFFHPFPRNSHVFHLEVLEELL